MLESLTPEQMFQPRNGSIGIHKDGNDEGHQSSFQPRNGSIGIDDIDRYLRIYKFQPRNGSIGMGKN